MSNMKLQYSAVFAPSAGRIPENSFLEGSYPGLNFDFPPTSDKVHLISLPIVDLPKSLKSELSNIHCSHLNATRKTEGPKFEFGHENSICIHKDSLEITVDILNIDMGYISSVFLLLEKFGLILVDESTGLIVGKNVGKFMLTMVHSRKFQKYYDSEAKTADKIEEIWKLRYRPVNEV